MGRSSRTGGLSIRETARGRSAFAQWTNVPGTGRGGAGGGGAAPPPGPGGSLAVQDLVEAGRSTGLVLSGDVGRRVANGDRRRFVVLRNDGAPHAGEPAPAGEHGAADRQDLPVAGRGVVGPDRVEAAEGVHRHVVELVVPRARQGDAADRGAVRLPRGDVGVLVGPRGVRSAHGDHGLVRRHGDVLVGARPRRRRGIDGEHDAPARGVVLQDQTGEDRARPCRSRRVDPAARTRRACKHECAGACRPQVGLEPELAARRRQARHEARFVRAGGCGLPEHVH
jgi:hypothetical protein